jgi:hypothetical protein
MTTTLLAAISEVEERLDDESFYGRVKKLIET